MTRSIAGRWHVAAIGHGVAYTHRQAFEEAARLSKTIREAVREGRGLNLSHWTLDNDKSTQTPAKAERQGSKAEDKGPLRTSRSLARRWANALVDELEALMKRHSFEFADLRESDRFDDSLRPTGFTGKPHRHRKKRRARTARFTRRYARAPGRQASLAKP